MIVLIAVVALLAGSPEPARPFSASTRCSGSIRNRRRRPHHRADLGHLVSPLHPADVLLHAGCPKAACRSAPRCAPGLRELKNTLGELKDRRGILRFLIARMIYQDGVNGLLILGGTFAAGMFGWATIEIGIYGIILNVVAIFGCLIAGRSMHASARRSCRHQPDAAAARHAGIVSTGPGYTLFGLVAAADRRFRRPVRHRCGEGLYRLRPADRARLRTRCRLRRAPIWRAASARRGRPLFRHLRPFRPRHEFHGDLLFSLMTL
jgi:UMF1 family MFS transporter